MSRSTTSTWWIPIGLVVLSLVPMIGGLVRLDGLVSGGPVTGENARFFGSPAPVVLHIFAAAIYSLVGAFQFSAGVRRRWPAWHRRAGRVLAGLGLVTAASGLWMTVVWDIPRPMQGPLLVVVRIMVALAMAAAIVLGVRAIWRRDVRSHEAWMIRAYALAQGAGAQVLWLGVPSIFVGELLGLQRDILMTVAWLGNVALAEWILRRRHAVPRSRIAGAGLIAADRP
jgi:hypothetical protein